MRHNLVPSLAVGLALCAVVPLHAAPITWGTPVGVGTAPGNSSDVSTNGTLVEAYNGTSTTDTNDRTVNGVTFVATGGLLNLNTSANTDISIATNGGDAAYDAILSTIDFGGGDSTTITIGDGDGDTSILNPGLLAVGTQYEIQVWFVDDRPDYNARVMGFASASSASKVNLNDQYVIGTFIADATTQTLFLDTVSPASGFGNTHITAYQIRKISDEPIPALASGSTDVSGPFTVDVNFSKQVTGLEESDFMVSNGSVISGSLAGGGTAWTIEIAPLANGDVTVILPAGSVTGLDGDNEPNPASAPLTVSFLAPGSDRPAATLATANNPAAGPFTVDVLFSEAVDGLDLVDFQVTGGSAGNLTGSGASYSILITPNAPTGEVTVILPAGSATDLDGDLLSNSVSNTLVTTVVIPTIPGVTLYGPLASSMPQAEISLTFTEDVSGLATEDFDVTNGSVTEVKPEGRARSRTDNSYIPSRIHYTAVVTADGPGTVEITLPAGKVLSLIGNGEANTASNTVSVDFTPLPVESWVVDDAVQWTAATKSSSNLGFSGGFAEPTANAAQFTSGVRAFPIRRKAAGITFKQSPVWDHWIPLSKDVNDSTGSDAPVLVPVGPDDYYMLAVRSGVYHAWHSTDMVNWTHRGPVTSGPEGRWVTSAEYKDGFFYIYSDFPNDHISHVFRDNDLGDGVPGTHLGPVLERDGSGSDLAAFRDDADGLFHLIYEDWSPISARTRAWDSPLAGRTSSADGINGFYGNEHPAPVDQRTNPTGTFGSFTHPHVPFDPTYEIHTPVQEAYGDWTAIKIGKQYYLFGDSDPAGQTMRVARFSSDSLYKEFELVGEVFSQGHPDPTIGFAEGQFYLITQYKDFRSPGPWVDGVEARAGVDQDGDGVTDTWTTWQAVSEQYDYTPGYIRVVTLTPAGLDLSALPAGYGFQFEFRIDNTEVSGVSPIMDEVRMEFTTSNFQNWAIQNGIQAMPNGDRDANGVPDLVEFALGQATVPERQADGSLTLTVTEESRADGYTVQLQFSEDLNDWTAATEVTPGVRLLDSNPQGSGDLDLKFSVQANNDKSLFWRLAVF